MNVGLIGYGRMGREIEAVALTRGHKIAAVVDPSVRRRGTLRALPGKGLRGVDVAFEFTTPRTAPDNVIRLIDAGIPVVCGTTGWDGGSPALRAALKRSSAGAVVAPNFSLGMNLFYRVVGEAARVFGATRLYDPFVFESHHRGKADAPSGTALRLARVVAEADPRGGGVHSGTPEGPVPPGAVHVASIRAGHETGLHTVGFDGAHDVVSLTHRARGRSGFALGAVLAGEWVEGRRGLHGFDEVLDDLLRGPGRRTHGRTR